MMIHRPTGAPVAISAISDAVVALDVEAALSELGYVVSVYEEGIAPEGLFLDPSQITLAVLDPDLGEGLVTALVGELCRFGVPSVVLADDLNRAPGLGVTSRTICLPKPFVSEQLVASISALVAQEAVRPEI